MKKIFFYFFIFLFFFLNCETPINNGNSESIIGMWENSFYDNSFIFIKQTYNFNTTNIMSLQVTRIESGKENIITMFFVWNCDSNFINMRLSDSEGNFIGNYTKKYNYLVSNNCLVLKENTQDPIYLERK